MNIRRRGDKIVIDILTRTPEGKRIRERRNAPDGVTSPSGAKRWGEKRQAILSMGGGQEERVSPLFRDFADRWMKEYVKAEGLKPSTTDAYERILRLHLTPAVGSMRLNQIGAPEVQQVKLAVASKSAKTRAGILTLLGEVLGAAKEWGELAAVPKIDKPKVTHPEMAFYDFSEYERLVTGAERSGPMVLASVLLGGDAGLRRGELIALEGPDCGGGALVVRRSDWEGKVGTPKGGRSRRIPLTQRLQEALSEVKHLRGKRLLWKDDEPVNKTTLQSWLELACRRAGLPESRNIHKLRHTFGAHLAMRGATAKAIQELMGHADLTTTQRYMHLSPAHVDGAIRLLEMRDHGAGVEQKTK